MDPSSLIFLAIIAIWAAYLVGHWVRRRDQLATARSIDRFSEAMRVLERRTPTRPVSAARATARSYVVAPVRVGGARSASPDLVASARGGLARAAAPGLSGRGLSGSSAQGSSGRGARLGTTSATDARPVPGARSAGARTRAAASRNDRPGITRAAARRRARLVLGLALVTVVAWVLVAGTGLAWWPAAVVTVALGAVLVQLRRTARRAVSAGRQASRASASGRSTRASAGRRSAPASAGRRSARASVRRPSTRSARARRGLAARVPAPARRRHHQDARSVLDQLQHARRAGETVAIATSSEAMLSGQVLGGGDGAELVATATTGGGGSSENVPADGGWQPVPVPPPTYTLKPKARPVVRRPFADTVDAVVDEAVLAPAGTAARPAATSSSQRDGVHPSGRRAPEPAVPAFDLDEILERRIASGS